jgi:pyruvate/2-oxoacid:ferredoxin oxidoreductase beta subunit
VRALHVHQTQAVSLRASQHAFDADAAIAMGMYISTELLEVAHTEGDGGFERAGGNQLSLP